MKKELVKKKETKKKEVNKKELKNQNKRTYSLYKNQKELSFGSINYDIQT